MLVLFPSDYFDIKSIDAEYQNEYEALCRLTNADILIFNYDNFVAGKKLKLTPGDYYHGLCIYRGWMLTPSLYIKLYNALLDQGIILINSPEQYSACHLFPAVRDELGLDTPASLIYANGTPIDWDEVNRKFKRFMIKDYVKSVKGTGFPSFFETPVNEDQIAKYVDEFIDLRGSLFTGGFVIKEYLDFKRYGQCTNEYRAYFLYGQLVSLSPNSNQPDACSYVPMEFVNRFNSLNSNYYTVDFGELSDGRWIVIETGDGQVSGLSPNQMVFKYYEEMKRILESRSNK